MSYAISNSVFDELERNIAEEIDICLNSSILDSLEFNQPDRRYFYLSRRAKVALEIAGINTFTAFQNLDVASLEGIAGVGKKTIAEITNAKLIIDVTKTLEEAKYNISLVRKFIKAIKGSLVPLLVEEKKLKLRIADIEKYVSITR